MYHLRDGKTRRQSGRFYADEIDKFRKTDLFLALYYKIPKMEQDINTIARYIPNINNLKEGRVQETKNLASTTDFKKILDKNILNDNSVKISSHAMERIKKDSIPINNMEIQKIENALDKLREKGSNESLLLSKDYAIIASVKNRTIITAMSGDRVKDNIFTNIDSTMLI